MWTQCNKPYELPACRIGKTSPELPIRVLKNVFCIVEMTEKLIVIHVVYAVSKSLETPSNIISHRQNVLKSQQASSSV